MNNADNPSALSKPEHNLRFAENKIHLIVFIFLLKKINPKLRNKYLYMSIKLTMHSCCFFSKAQIMFWSWEVMGVVSPTRINFSSSWVWSTFWEAYFLLFLWLLNFTLGEIFAVGGGIIFLGDTPIPTETEPLQNTIIFPLKILLAF